MRECFADSTEKIKQLKEELGNLKGELATFQNVISAQPKQKRKLPIGISVTFTFLQSQFS